MTSRICSPAIFAGLSGAAAWAGPTAASAATVSGTFPVPSAGMSFVAGALVGAVVASGTSVVMSRVLDARDAARVSAGGASAGESATDAASAPASASSSAKASVKCVPSRDWKSEGADGPAPQPADLVDVAEDYVRGITRAGRVAARAKGVAGVLAERLGSSRMEGLPVIERADGSVADLGESWWDDAMATEGMSVAAPSMSFSASEEAERPERRPSANAEVAARVAPVAEEAEGSGGVPAAAKSVSAAAEDTADLKREDLWAVALAALDDKFEEQIAIGPESQDVAFGVGDDDHDPLDEPEGLEPVTRFMPFRPQAGHPEVDDTDSYVDLLIDQEFSRNRSDVARDSARKVAKRFKRSYLKVIDGGTGEVPTAAATRSLGRRPRHLAARRA